MDPVEAQVNYEKFIERVKLTGEVWGLCRDTEEWAYSDSDEYEDTEVLLFWSDEALALEHQQDEWSEHETRSIPLDEFVDKWLQGMDQDGVLVGPNWNADFVGMEVTPEELAQRLLAEPDEGYEEEEEE